MERDLVRNHRHERTAHDRTRAQRVYGELIMGGELTRFEGVEDVAAAHDSVSLVAVLVRRFAPYPEAVADFVSHHKLAHYGRRNLPHFLPELDMADAVTGGPCGRRMTSGGIPKFDHDFRGAAYRVCGMRPDRQRDNQVGDEGSHAG